MNSPKILIFDDINSLSLIAAERVTLLANEAVDERDQFTIALSGGGTPQKLYDFLSQPPYDGKLPWKKTHIFWGDERCVPPDQEGSNYYQAQQSFLGRIHVPAGNVHRVRGEFGPEKAAQDYTQQLQRFAQPGGRAWPRFDLVLLGMGTDGHTASLFPGPVTDLERVSPVLPVTAHYGDRPADRVTLTPLVFNAARQIIFLVSGEQKAATLYAVLNDDYDPDRLPAQRVRPSDGEVSWFVDQAAAKALKTG